MDSDMYVDEERAQPSPLQDVSEEDEVLESLLDVSEFQNVDMQDLSFENDAVEDAAGPLNRPGTLPLTLTDFVSTASELHAQQKYKQFVRWVLNGITSDGQQITLEPYRNRITDDLQPLVATKDYDSVIGLDESIRIKCDLTVPLIASFDTTLKNNIHLRYHFQNKTVC